ncbi:MAG: hypothetical protein ACO1QR_13565 [Chthoniobacteraceae bacterium]
MKRFLPVLGLVVVVVAFAALVPKLRTGKSADTKWRPLPKGGEIAFYAVTVGTHHEMDHPKESLLKRMTYVAKTRSLRPLWASPGRSGSGSTAEPAVAIWLAFRNTSNHPQLQGKSELVLPDGQIYLTGSSGSSGSDKGLVHTTFGVLPYTVETLTFAGTLQGERFQWEIPNPAYQPKINAGKASELPQTSRVGEYELTLRELVLEHREYPPTNWGAEPVYKVSRHGQDVSQWFEVSSTNSERGLLSAPSWIIKATLSRTSAYPFAPEEIEWLGKYDKARLDALKPAEHELYPVSDAGRARGIIMAGIFGTGQYHLRKNEVVRSQALPEPLPKRPNTSVIPNTEDMEVTLEKASLIIVSTYSDGVLVFRTDSDKQVQVHDRWSHGYTYSIRIYDAPKEAVRIGVAGRKEPAMEGQSIEFVVKPPQIPTGVDPRTGARVEPSQRN